MNGSFFVVATPIGNLQDLSPRAQSILCSAKLILCEDTRHSYPLLTRIGAQGKTLSCHQHNEEERIETVIERLQEGDDVALISDAGAPALSDPGGRLIDGLVAQNIKIEVVPGPTALGASLMGAGLNTTRFSFLGFLPKRTKARRELVRAALSAGFAAIIYEAPTRVKATLADLAVFAGENRRVVVARELTKKFETFHRGMLGGPLTPPLLEKGEMVIVIEGGDEELLDEVKTLPEQWALNIAQEEGLSPKERTKKLMECAHCSRKEAYTLLLAVKNTEDAMFILKETSEYKNTLSIVAESKSEGEKRALLDVKKSLDLAISVFLQAEQARAGASQEALCEYLAASQHVLPAPTEAAELARALLGSIAALDALQDAIDMAEDSLLDKE